MSPDINYGAVLAAAFASFVLGFLWYGPLFGRLWASLVGVDFDSMKPRAAPLITVVITTLVMSFVLAHSLIFASAYLHVSGIRAGLSAGFWNWLGFVAPVALGPVLYEGKPIRLWFINAGFYLVSLLVMGVILALWP